MRGIVASSSASLLLLVSAVAFRTLPPGYSTVKWRGRVVLPSSSRKGLIRATATTVSADAAGDYISPARPTAVSLTEAKPTTKANILQILWRFTRPHTFIGTTLCIPALHLYAAPAGSSIWSLRVLWSILWALLPSAFINVYITGLNQVTDVEIDKVNKPYLPIAAGELSKMAGTLVVVASLIAGLGLGLVPSPFASASLLWVLIGSVVLGTSYSLPPLRLKRFPLLAAFCIIAVRGALINVGFYGHALKAAFSGPELSLVSLLSDVKCVSVALFYAVFGAVIAFMKDVPDVKGDEMNKIRSFSVRLGPTRMFQVGSGIAATLWTGTSVLLFMAARNAIVAAGGLLTAPAVGKVVLSLLALGSGVATTAKAKEVNPTDGKQVYDFYMFLWRLFHLSYLFLPLAR